MVSVIMTAFNAEQYIKTSIESVLNQTLKNWELIIINDGSQDDTETIVKAFDDPRIKYFFQVNKGVSAARNAGLEQISGEYFCFLDADDYLTPESLNVRFQYFCKNPDLDFLDGKINIYDRNLENIINQWMPKFRGNPLKELLNISGSCFFNPSWMIKRKYDFNYHFNEDLSHGEDLLFFIDISEWGGTYDFVDDVILHYRKGHHSAMKNLIGLEQGYKQIYKSILSKERISINDANNFKRKARRIILRSYLGNFQIKNAMLSTSKSW